jgi:hypothetical protein
MRAGLLVLVIAACSPRVASSPRIVENDLDMPPPGAMKDSDQPAADPAPRAADPSPAEANPPPAADSPPVAIDPARSGAAVTAHTPTRHASATTPPPAHPTALEPARPVAAWPPAARPAVDASDEVPDSQRIVAPPGKGQRTGTIARGRLLAILNAGPGNFLRQLEVAPRLSGDRFIGWQLVQLIDPGGPLHDLDLISGDILLAINGNPLSRPEHLQAMWDSLRTANEVTARLWRGDKKFDLRFKIEPQVP